ncbi:MAG: ParB/RepB/Spo0J family partition protein [Verrucomicrobiales bacterium]
MSSRVALGKGLGALLQTKVSPEPNVEAGESVQRLALEEIKPSPFQPRKSFRESELAELVESIRTQGIIQPLIVRKVGYHFELIAGERRWRAATKLGLSVVPAIVRTATDQEVLELALIENLQRADLDPIEEADAYRRLAQEFQLTQEDIALKVGRSRAAVANALRLLDLDVEVQSYLSQQRISVGHAKVLLGLRKADEQRAVADQVIRNSATVRDTERLVKDFLGRNGEGRPAKSGAAASSKATTESRVYASLEGRLRDFFGTQVRLAGGSSKGRIEIEFYGNSDLQRILDLLGLENED